MPEPTLCPYCNVPFLSPSPEDQARLAIPLLCPWCSYAPGEDEPIDENLFVIAKANLSHLPHEELYDRMDERSEHWPKIRKLGAALFGHTRFTWDTLEKLDDWLRTNNDPKEYPWLTLADVAAKLEADAQSNAPAPPPPRPVADVPHGTPADDPTAYRPMKEFVDEQYPTPKAIHKALKKNKWIRRRRPIGKRGLPIPNRLEIHAGDWQEFLTRQPVDPLDSPATIVDAVMEMEKRKAEIDKRKGRK